MVLNLHRDELHPLEGEACPHEDSQPTQKVICGFIFDQTRAIESAGVVPVLDVAVRTLISDQILKRNAL